jgi:succinate dehydrogenase/fumarate reductase-like Fe-S protein
MNEESQTPHVDIFVRGKKYEVPYGLTIMDAIEYAGFRLIRGSGCRQGMCGACATLYRLRGDYKLRTALACQELVKDGMLIFPVSYSPANKATYDIDALDSSETILLEYYPEIARCLCCNTCTKACPQELEVMTIVQAALKGDLEEVSRLSFECVECGLCALRCPAEIVPYYVTRLARRLYGRYVVGMSGRVEKRRREIAEGLFDEELEKICATDIEKIRELYRKRDFV